jgi:hypothetical protein
MKRRNWLLLAAGALSTLLVASQMGIAQESGAIPGAAAPGTVSPKVEAADPEIRYQFMIHDYTVNGFDYELHLKLDTFTGKTWKFHASTARWTPIPEKEGSSPLEASSTARYELNPHAYLDTNGVEQELYMRVDTVSGRSWTYRGSNGTWREIEQDD